WWHNQNEVDEEQVQDARNDKAAIFWALLLLSSQSKVELSQEEFYQDLSLRPLNFMPGFP
nr:segregation/condensation protein A [Xenococcaceae cyanobacterium MO_188.B19]